MNCSWRLPTCSGRSRIFRRLLPVSVTRCNWNACCRWCWSIWSRRWMARVVWSTCVMRITTCWSWLPSMEASGIASGSPCPSPCLGRSMRHWTRYGSVTPGSSCCPCMIAKAPCSGCWRSSGRSRPMPMCSRTCNASCRACPEPWRWPSRPVSCSNSSRPCWRQSSRCWPRGGRQITLHRRPLRAGAGAGGDAVAAGGDGQKWPAA